MGRCSPLSWLSLCVLIAIGPIAIGTAHAGERVGYMRGSSPPWSSSSNETAMTSVFGAGNWSDLRFAGGAGPFAVGTGNDYGYLFLDGSDGTAVEFSGYLTANRTAIDNWVTKGGRLILNSAPNVGGSFSMGFGVTLTYSPPATSINAVKAADAAHPVFNDPIPTGTQFSGNSFAHARVSGAGLKSIIVSTVGDQIALAEKLVGGGCVLFGGMTTSNFHSPQPQGEQLRANIVRYAFNCRGDSDGDGIPDSVETENGLDPEDPADAAGDLDGDLLTNLEEYIAKTDLKKADTDMDGLGDAVEVKEKGTNPLKADTDGDGFRDDADPVPQFILAVVIEKPFAALISTPATLRIRLEDPTGGLVLTPVQFNLSASGAATFAATAAVGAVVSGGGTASVVLESAGGLVEIQISDGVGESVSFSLADTSSIGLKLAGTGLLDDVEGGEGDWTHEVLSGPASDWSLSTARKSSGSHSWHSGPSAPGTGDAVLVSSPLDLRGSQRSSLEFRHWYAFDNCNDPNFLPDGGVVEVRILPDGPWNRIEPEGDYPKVLNNPCANPLGPPGTVGAYSDSSGDDFLHAEFDLSGFLGEQIQIRFHVGWDCGNCNVREGWFIDDIEVELASRLIFLDPIGDYDGDGISTSDEYANGTDPLRADTDRDGIGDGVETGTGVFVDATDTGTDPLKQDTDGDGVADGTELVRGLHPLNPDTDGDALADGVETNTGNFQGPSDTGTDPLKVDTDGDTLGDGAEVAAGLNPVNPDTDGDGASDGIDPVPAYPVYIEIVPVLFYGLTSQPAMLNIRLRDPNGDIVASPPALRFTLTASGAAVFENAASTGSVITGGGTNGVLVEASAGALDLGVRDLLAEQVVIEATDSEPIGMFSDPAYVSFIEPMDDEDGDDLLNADESTRGTDPFSFDTDGDGLADGAETGSGVFVDVSSAGTDPLVADSDGDGALDGAETAAGSNPTDPLSLPTLVPGAPIDFSTEIDPSLLVLNGNAARDAAAGTLVLTEPISYQNGNAVLANQVTTDDLEVGFDFRISSPGGQVRGTGADGIALAIIAAPGPFFLGAPGGALGIGGLPWPTVAFAADTWQNATDISDNHFEMHYYPGGVPNTDNLPGFIQNPAPFNLRDGRLYHVEFLLSGGHATVKVTPPGGAEFVAIDADIPDFVPFSGYLGFTASTGADWERQEVDNLRVPARALSISTVEPASGPGTGGTEIEIRGFGFVDGDTEVSIGGVPAQSVTFVDETMLRALTPAHASGPAAVQVSIPGFTVGLPGAFLYTPFISSVQPRYGLEGGGTATTISGLGFLGGTTVQFGAVPSAGVTVEGPETMRVTVPAGTGVVDLSVANADGTHTRPGAFRYLAPGGDFDADGLANAGEFARGSNPGDADTDDDGLGDLVETATGVFVDASDTGTDPAKGDTDDGGVWDPQEIDEGTSPFDPTDDYLPISALPLVLTDGEGFNWDIVDHNGNIGSGTDDTFSGMFLLQVSGIQFGSPFPARLGRGGEELKVGPAILGPFEVTRSVFVPGSSGRFIRYRDEFKNLTGSTLEFFVGVYGYTRWGSDTRVRATSSGDLALSPADDWIVVGDRLNRGSEVTVVFAGDFGPARPSTVLTNNNGYFYWQFNLVVPPGETVALLTFASQSADIDSAIENARSLTTLAGRALDFISQAKFDEVQNFGRDTDGDHISDSLERRLGLDPANPADGAGDLDADGLTNTREADLKTLLDDADTDDDGLLDGAEVAAGSNPLNSDTDGDGTPDGSDPFPLFKVELRLSGVAVGVTGKATLIRVELRDPQGGLLSGRTIRFTLSASLGGGFAASAEEGTLIGGGGTGEAVVETATGVVALAFIPNEVGDLQIIASDSADIGIDDFVKLDVVHRINCGYGARYTDKQGRIWSQDRFFTGGAAANFGAVTIAGTDDPTIYRTERWADAFAGQSMSYALPVEPGRHEIVLHFAEVFDGVRPPNPPRLFNVLIEGNWVLQDFNITEAMGGWRVAGTRTFDFQIFDGTVDLFLFGGNSGHVNPKISAIEVFKKYVGPPFHVVRVLSADGDDDADLSRNAREVERGTLPDRADTDGDGLIDGVEDDGGIFVGLLQTGTDPLEADGDADGLADGIEVRLGTDPLRAGGNPPALPENQPLSLLGGGLECGLNPDHTMAGGSGRGLVLKDPATGADVLNFLATAGSHEMFSIKYVKGADVSLFINGLVGLPVSFRPFDGSGGGIQRVVAVGDAGSLAVRQEVRLDPGEPFVRLKLALTNMGGTELKTVKYLRNIDPTIGDEPTYNDIFQPMMMIASGASGASLVMGTSSGLAIASVEGQKVADPDSVLGSPNDPNLQRGDLALNLAFNAGNLAPGQTVEFEIIYAVGTTPEEARFAFARSIDSDSDRIPDVVEVRHGLNPGNPDDGAADLDGDGVSNADEYAQGTGLSDPDSDGDGLADGAEAGAGADPLLSDTDGDGLDDGEEALFGGGILVADTDGDGYGDGLESRFGGDPAAPGVTPALPNPINFQGVGNLSEIAGYRVIGSAALADGRLLLPTNDQSGVGGFFRDERIDGTFLFAAFDLEILPGAGGHGDGVSIAIVGAPTSPFNLGAAQGGLGLAGIQHPTLAIEIDIAGETGDPPVAHVGIDYFPQGVPAAPGRALPSLTTVPLPAVPAGGVFHFEVELSGGTVGAYLVGPAGGAARQPILSHRILGYEPIEGFAGVVGASSQGNRGSHALNSLVIAGGGPVAIAGVVPSSGPLAGGTAITIAGSGFGAVPEVFIGANEAQVVSASNVEIRAIAPAGESPGPRNVYVLTQAGGGRLAAGFTYAPYLRAVIPATGPAGGGGYVRLVGTGFSEESPAEVHFGATKAAGVLFVSDSVLEVKVPPGARGPVDVSARLGGALSVLRGGFRYLPAVSVPSGAAKIQDAIAAAEAGGLVLVEPGVYPESIDLGGKPIEIRAAAGPAATTIAGSGGDGPVVKIAPYGDGVLRGFTVKGGRGAEGSGVLVGLGARVGLHDLVVSGNEGPQGRGITIGQGASFEIDRTIVSANRCLGGSGGGILIGALANGRVSNSLIVGNSAGQSGGGMAAFEEPPPQAAIAHCTIAANSAGQSGGGVRIAFTPETLLVNSILWGNLAASGPDLAGGASGSVKACDIKVNPFSGTSGNFSEDPRFIDPAGGDYGLRGNSPAIDAGDPSGAMGLDLDLAGLARLADGDGDGEPQPDLGAFESNAPQPSFVRGDSSADGTLDISDPIDILGFLFLGDEPAGCLDAADANDDGDLNITDPIFALGYLFLAGPIPPEPGPNRCGRDPTADQGVGGDLGCDSPGPCP